MRHIRIEEDVDMGLVTRLAQWVLHLSFLGVASLSSTRDIGFASLPSPPLAHAAVATSDLGIVTTNGGDISGRSDIGIGIDDGCESDDGMLVLLSC